MMRALVTGGAGVIGSHIYDLLKKRRYETISADLDGDYADMQLDIAVDTFPEERFDVIFHCAGLLGTETLFRHIQASAKVNIMGTLRLMEWASNMRQPVTVIQPNLIGEWLNPYMISKHAAEQYGLMYDKYLNVRYLSIRPTDVYGPGQALHQKKAASNFIVRAILDQDIEIYGDGSSWVNYVYVEDVAKFMVDAYEQGHHGEIIAFSDPSGDTTILKFAQKVIEVSGSKSEIIFGHMRKGQPGSIHRIDHNLRPASLITDLSELTKLTEGLKKTIEWYRENRPC